MTPEELRKAGEASVPLDAALRKDLLKSLASAFPTMLISMSMAWLNLRFVNQPGQALWIIIPGIIFLGFFYLRKKTRQELTLGWPFLAFLSVFILVFVIAAESRVLDWRSTLTGYEDTVPQNFLALNRFGDWHYKVMAEKAANQDLAIVLISGKTIEERRLHIADLIDYAKTAHARGVALDFHFLDTQEEGRELDEYLCGEINSADGVGLAKEGSTDQYKLPVLVGYDFELTADGIRRVRIDKYLEQCLPDSNQGHAVGYVEWDSVVRSIPMYLGTNRSLKALSLVIAERLASNTGQQIEAPSNGLLQFTKPASDFKTITWEKVWSNHLAGDESDQSDFQDRFILVGADDDTFRTPYGDRKGVVIHAYAIHSLMQNQYIRREGWRVSLLVIFALCYLMMILASRGVGNLKLILMNFGFSVLVAAIAIVSMRCWLTWIDLVYPLLAAWLFLLLLIGLRKVGMRKAVAATR